MFRGLGKYRQVYGHLWRTYGRSGTVRLSFFMHLITRICKLVLLPIALSLVITQLSQQNYGGAYEAVAFFVSASLLIGLVTPLTKYVGMLGENKVYDQATSAYFAKLVGADLDYFHSNLAGYLTTATRQYVDSCVQLVRALRDKYMTTILSIVFPLIVIWWLDVWIGVVALVLSIIQAAYLIWASNAITPHRTAARELYKKNSGRMADIISNILAVRSNAQEATYIKEVGKGAAAEATAFKRRYTMQAKLTAAREFITVGFFMVLLWLTVQRMSSGAITITTAVIVVTYTTTIMTAIYSLSDDLDGHDDLVDKVIPAFDILERQNAIKDPARPKKLEKVKGAISFEDVSFAYDVGDPVFEGFSLDIPAGQKVGVVGLSGAGKSTLTKLLLRFNDVTGGAVKVDGLDVRDVRQTALRSQIAYVPQEPLLFHATIKENVLLSQPDATEAQVRRALKQAHAWPFVQKLPDGMNSVVGERGVKLSGGQKQRVAIARAVLRQTPIIILDEATSALDSESEQIIKNSFAEILKGKTALVIAHRLSTLSEMDRVVVIENGTCVEDGSHAELLARGGIYAKLWNRQLQVGEGEQSAELDTGRVADV
jgi:ATP-binding cassette subfamily B protein